MNVPRYSKGASFIALALLVTPALAGVGSSGGDFAVVCRDTAGRIVSARTADLFEAEASGLTLVASSGDTRQDYMRGILTYRELAADGRPIGRSEENHYDTIMESLRFVPNANALANTSDLGEEMALPTGCHYEQLAVFEDATLRIFVNEEIWRVLGAQDRAALFHHEVFYSMYRAAGEKNSLEVRRAVGKIFSTEPGPSLRDIAHKTRTECFGQERRGPSTTLTIVDTGADKSAIYIRAFLDRVNLVPMRFEVDQRIRPDGFEVAPTADGQDIYARVRDPRANLRQTILVTEGPFRGYGFEFAYRYREPLSLSIWNPQGRLIRETRFTRCSSFDPSTH